MAAADQLGMRAVAAWVKANHGVFLQEILFSKVRQYLNAATEASRLLKWEECREIQRQLRLPKA